MEIGAFDKHPSRLRQALKAQHTGFAHAIGGHPFPAGTHATRPSEGYLLWLEMLAGTGALDVHRAAPQESIGVAPGPILSASEGLAN